MQKGLKPVKAGQKQEENGAGLKGHEGRAAAKTDGNVKLAVGDSGEEQAEGLYEEDDMIQLDVDIVQLEEAEIEMLEEPKEAGGEKKWK